MSSTRGTADDRQLAKLQAKGINQWTIDDVVKWLQLVGLGEYSEVFKKNVIGGPELLEITEADLPSLSITSVGHRKRFHKFITQLKTGERPDNESSEDSDSVSGSSGSGSGSGSKDQSSDSKKETIVKCIYKGDVVPYKIKESTTFEKLKSKAKFSFGHRMIFKYEDPDGELIEIKNNQDMRRIFKLYKPPYRFQCYRKKSSSSSVSEAAPTKVSLPESGILEGMVDGIIIIDKTGRILFFNKAAEKIWGFSRQEVLDRNVKMLMPASYGVHHDSYLENYLRTGHAKIIGTGRAVLGQHKEGYPISLDLSVTETKSADRHTFTGTVRLSAAAPPAAVGASAAANDASRFGVLDALLEQAIVINQKGTLLFMNRKALEFFGYKSDEVLGRNINVLMPSPHKENHDHYMQNYLISGVAKVLGKERHVICELKDGSVTSISLSVSEQINPDGTRIFTGIVRPIVRSTAAPKSLLVQDREVLQTLLVPAAIIDPNGTIQAFNPAAEKLFGYSLDEVLGQNVKMICAPPHAEKHDDYLRNYMTTRIAKVIGKERIVNGLHKNGSLIKLSLSVTERKDGEKVYFTGMMHSANAKSAVS